MRNPFRPRPSSRRQDSTCQIIHVERADQAMVVDLVTLAPAARGAERVPAGTPMALDFGSEPLSVDRMALALLLARWERDSAIIDLTIDEDPDGLRYDLSCGDEQISVVAGAPSGPA